LSMIKIRKIRIEEALLMHLNEIKIWLRFKAYK
jgi:hypothetical protein